MTALEMQGETDALPTFKVNYLGRSFIFNLLEGLVHHIIVVIIIVIIAIIPFCITVTSVLAIIAWADGTNESHNTLWNAHPVAPPHHPILSSDETTVQNVALVATTHSRGKN